MTSTRARYAGLSVPLRDYLSRLLSWRGLAREHRVELIAIGNGTASRETDRLWCGAHPAPSRAQVNQGGGLGGRGFDLLCFGFCLAGIAWARPARSVLVADLLGEVVSSHTGG